MHVTNPWCDWNHSSPGHRDHPLQHITAIGLTHRWKDGRHIRYVRQRVRKGSENIPLQSHPWLTHWQRIFRKVEIRLIGLGSIHAVAENTCVPTVIGTSGYRAPEICAGTAYINCHDKPIIILLIGLIPRHATDMFSAGIVLMELAAGNNIFHESPSLRTTLAVMEHRFGQFGERLANAINLKFPDTFILHPIRHGTPAMRINPQGLNVVSKPTSGCKWHIPNVPFTGKAKPPITEDDVQYGQRQPRIAPNPQTTAIF